MYVRVHVACMQNMELHPLIKKLQSFQATWKLLSYAPGEKKNNKQTYKQL